MREKQRALVVTVVLLCLTAAVVLYSLNTGTLKLSPLVVVKTLFGFGDFQSETVLFDYRLPRIVVTMLAGIGLGIAGGILQSLSRNPLADPGIIGLNAGAAFGLIVFVTYFHALEGNPSLLIPLFTFGGGLLAAAVIVLLAYNRQEGLVPIRLILVGIAVAAGFSALTLYLSLKLNEDTYTFASRWLVGNVWGRDWIHVLALLPWIVCLVPLTLMQSNTLNALTLGDAVASSVGVRVQRQRLLLLTLAVGLASASVSMTGGIGFIGLVAPHLARRLVGSLHQYFLPVSALLGLLILVSADTIGRSIFAPNAIPAGVVVAFIGAPYFLYLLTKTK
ncbi:FecCD family ABC transporter permease [Bacillus pumilus]|jgi:iron complex transport system permease protein|uniref:FecCD family ABC transporter permease n=1 Tax=Bacillus pumilus TaxID=1408 RepID=UPI0008201BE5|nr:iron ABC transporter permease [Bacillus pumilus]AOC55356.1 iron ABC transporter permease [Bacillus pumilus]MBR0587044.1 iron ABC transporter permease [Bacillus pumilus DW2J2]MBR0617665.1 iron ABC transporter permease [Bacillus pumilus]MBR0624789.1 iron ABC transporter permease [Bacillus pumilus]MCY7724148.1 iron ABC transporter permease [Bacillus pumilus]